MKLVYFKQGGRQNFGDDLNAWMWESLLPNELRVEDGVNLSGIGTILNASLMPMRNQWVVLGSGVGYGFIPHDFGESNWKVLAVRGPLSASILKLSPNFAITDAAILLSQCFSPLPESERSGIVFMPHHGSVPGGKWELACALAGIEYLDPLSDSRLLVERIRRAKLVIADAMHAAIVADTMRVPWIPVVTGTAISTFKWLDWARSLHMEYQPYVLHASSRVEELRNATNWTYGEANYVQNIAEESVLAHFRYAQKRRSARWWGAWVRGARCITYSMPAKIINGKRIRGSHVEARTECAATDLRLASKAFQTLSSDRIFEQRKEQMLEAIAHVPRCIAELRAGRDLQR